MRMDRHIRSFRRNEDGTVVVLWAMGLVVFLAVLALTFDVGKIGVTRAELQSFSDSVALAAAGELDGKADAITRATAAASQLISDKRTFGSGSTTLAAGSYALSFLSALPAQDTAATSAVTTTPADAKFARVQANPAAVSMIFLRAVNTLLGNGSAQIDSMVQAEAIAGFTQEACDITPLMFCLPSPNFTATANIGTMIHLRAGGSGASFWGPGDFGFLDPTKSDLGATCQGLNGAKLNRCLIGAELAVTQCFTQRGVDTEPGQKEGIEPPAFNVRFDIYEKNLSSYKNNPDYPAAPNVIKGLVPGNAGACIGTGQSAAVASPDTMALPRDTCLAAGTCPYPRFGNKVWARQAYLDMNHDHDGDGTGSDSHLMALTIDPRFAGSGTRYEMYLREIAYSQFGALPGNAILDGLAETGLPTCTANVSPRPERRVVVAAGIDCTANPINGAEVGVPVEEFFELFMTETVGNFGSTNPPTVDFYVEILGSAGGDGYGSAGSGGIFRDVVQLYR